MRAHVWKRRLKRHRRLIAVVPAGLATACTLAVLRPAQPATVAVLAAARDLRVGPLRPGDLTTVHLPADLVPHGALRPHDSPTGESADLSPESLTPPTTGRVLASPMRRGEPLTDARLLGPGMLSGYGADAVAMPVRVADPEAVRLLSPGDIVDVLAAPSGWAESDAQPAATVADNATVITTRHTGDSHSGALIVLATTPDQAARLAGAQPGGHLSIMIEQRR
ncbi:Flp pilus assembly protein CpaB [Sinosporangium album]|uniref:Flp pilus assembly protein CpaB n=1 Tax=Sinosporangium album TaxID=504805 RepID=A0A1G8A4G0_9ACTN|nr:RcpC/CpaB family pilus assembly protein [Sinosporangium album]SDH15819.1 Flp pilus assembly protein CpaB [Sinosporangium album]